MQFRGLVFLVALMPAMPLMAQEVALLPAGDGDFVVSGEVSQLRDGVTRAEGVQGDPASVFMPNPDEGLSTALRAPENDSRSYSLSVSARELSSGVSLPLTATGAVLRVAPEAGRGARSLQADDVVIRQGAWALRGRSAARDLAQGRELADAAPVFGHDTVAMRLSDRIGPGEAVLQVRDAALMRGGRYRLHVFEPDSPVRASLGAERPVAALGEALRAGGRLLGGDDLSVQRVEGDLISPDGRRFPLDWTAGDGAGFDTQLTLPRRGAQADGLWELEARLEGVGRHGPVRRDVRVAFEAVAPTARLSGQIEVLPATDGWTLEVGVDVGTPGRYELRATLPGEGTAHTARWLESGPQTLVLSFPGTMPRQAVLRDLRLVDQSRVALLHVQQQALTLGGV